MIRTANLTTSISRNAGGLFESVRRLVQSLIETGMDVHVFGLQDKFTGPDVEAWQPASVSAFKPTWPQKFGYSPRFLEELVAFDPDITHTHGIWVYPSVATNVYSRKRSSPYLISPHGMLDQWAVKNSHWRKVIAYYLYEGAHLRGARCLRALCESEALAIRELGLRNEIAVIPNGIDLPLSAPTGKPPWEGFVEPGKKVLLFLSRIHPKKGLVNLVRAWAKTQSSIIRPQNSNWVLAIAGWDQAGHERELKTLATELGISWTDRRNNSTPKIQASILFLGPQFNEEKAASYHYCDAFILPSFSEGVPMVVLEAWANSKAVVMTPECNLPQGFTAKAALKIEATEAGVTEGLSGLFRLSDADRGAMGQRGFALTTESFAWPRIAQQMKAVYEWMLGGGTRPS